MPSAFFIGKMVEILTNSPIIIGQILLNSGVCSPILQTFKTPDPNHRFCIESANAFKIKFYFRKIRFANLNFKVCKKCRCFREKCKPWQKEVPEFCSQFSFTFYADSCHIIK